jgi:addiction module RelE/StbE family toxin
MKVRYSHSFHKQFRKLSVSIQDKFAERIVLFVADSTHPCLRVHPLKGNHAGYWSMNITGDVRAVYKREGKEMILLVLIGTHSQLYG